MPKIEDLSDGKLDFDSQQIESDTIKFILEHQNDIKKLLSFFKNYKYFLTKKVLLTGPCPFIHWSTIHSMELFKILIDLTPRAVLNEVVLCHGYDEDMPSGHCNLLEFIALNGNNHPDIIYHFIAKISTQALESALIDPCENGWTPFIVFVEQEAAAPQSKKGITFTDTVCLMINKAFKVIYDVILLNIKNDSKKNVFNYLFPLQNSKNLIVTIVKILTLEQLEHLLIPMPPLISPIIGMALSKNPRRLRTRGIDEPVNETGFHFIDAIPIELTVKIFSQSLPLEKPVPAYEFFMTCNPCLLNAVVKKIREANFPFPKDWNKELLIHKMNSDNMAYLLAIHPQLSETLNKHIDKAKARIQQADKLSLTLFSIPYFHRLNNTQSTARDHNQKTLSFFKLLNQVLNGIFPPGTVIHRLIFEYVTNTLSEAVYFHQQLIAKPKESPYLLPILNVTMQYLNNENIAVLIILQYLASHENVATFIFQDQQRHLALQKKWDSSSPFYRLFHKKPENEDSISIDRAATQLIPL